MADAKEVPLNDEELRKLLKPAPDESQVLQVLQTSYSDDDSTKVIKQLDSYDDANYLVEIRGVPYLLKIHNGVESRDLVQSLAAASGDYYKSGCMTSCIHLQNAIMVLLDQNEIVTSSPVPPKDSKMPLSVHTLPVMCQEEPYGTCDLVVRLLTFVPGSTMQSKRILPLECLADAGRFLGKMDKVLDRMTPNPLQRAAAGQADSDASLLIPARRYHQWDGKNTADLRKYLHCIHDEKRRHLVESVLDAFSSEILETGVAQDFRTGVIHGDFNDANILLDDDFSCCGVIDFGDSVESWRVLDVSIAMAYGMLSTYGKANRMLSAAAAVLRGFNAVYPLTDQERKHLVLLIACRLACSVTLGAYSFEQNPDNHYLLMHAEPAWKALELIWCYDAEQRARVAKATNRLFDQACLYSYARESTITCYDLVIPDPGVADLLQSVRVPSFDIVEVPKTSKKREHKGLPVITFVTGNAKKLEEVQRILRTEYDGYDDTKLPYHLTNQKVDLPELQGESIHIAREKCLAAAAKVGGAVITEDTSLCFNALNELPGPYIKWFLEKLGHEGLNKMIGAYDDKTGFAQTIVAFSPGPGKDPAIFDGRTSGKIVMPRGKLDFGWDPIFEPDEGEGKTYAEMSKAEKDAISHRSRAFGQLREYLSKHKDTINQEIDDFAAMPAPASVPVPPKTKLVKEASYAHLSPKKKTRLR